VTKNDETVFYEVRYRNEYNSIKPFNEDLREGKSGASSRGNSGSRGVYIIVVAAKKLVAGSASLRSVFPT